MGAATSKLHNLQQQPIQTSNGLHKQIQQAAVAHIKPAVQHKQTNPAVQHNQTKLVAHIKLKLHKKIKR